MQLFIKGLKTSVLNVEETETVLGVKEKLSNSDGIPCEDQVLSFAGRPLADEETLSSYGLEHLSTISVDVRMLGGNSFLFSVSLPDLSVIWSCVCVVSIIVCSTMLYISGKVHGSLARAGKVKGQTPKVS